ncbi:MAG: MIP/aquaporin family protein [Pseudomonadota bacterium]
MSNSSSIDQRLAAEAIGTGFLLATVVGSGIMAERLAGGNVAIALLGNTLPTGAILYVLITMLGPVSGAHFNPAVTLVFRLRGDLSNRVAIGFVAAQLVGGVIGVMLANLMFELPAISFSSTARSGGGQWLGEFVATLGLIGTILCCVRYRPESVAMAVGLFITAAYWFTSSTSFANPAVTVARTLSDTFAGISPAHAPAFIVVQLVAAAVALRLFDWLTAAND